MLVIGRNPIIETLNTDPNSLNKVIFLKNPQLTAKIKEIAELCKENNIKTMFLGKNDFTKFFPNKDKSEGITQGVIGFIKDFEYTSLPEIIEESKKIKNPLILILDEITDPHNMGAVIRSAVCLAADGIIIPRHNSAEVNHTVIKTSSGAVNHIKIAKETNLNNSLQYLKKNGYWIIGTDISAEKTVFESDLKIPIGLVIGSEGKGMRKSIKDNCDILLRIPMAGSMNSLNASVSAGIFLYEIFRQKNIS